MNFSNKISFIWSIAELLRGPWRPNQYKNVILPLIVLRRLDCVLEPTKDEVLKKYEELKSRNTPNPDFFLNKITGYTFNNKSSYTIPLLLNDPDNIGDNLRNYINGFSEPAKSIFSHFKFEQEIPKLEENDRLYLIIKNLTDPSLDLHPDVVSNIEMGYIFEELIRKFNEVSNEEAGDHFTPREVIRVMVNILFEVDKELLSNRGVIRKLYDPACGTGGMLSVSEDYLRDLNPHAKLKVYGQDYNDEAYAICGSDMLIKGQDPAHICFGDTFKNDQLKDELFDYMLANPPFGVEWKSQESVIKEEYELLGKDGRFEAGYPPINDGSLLFLQHMISKMKPVSEGGSRIGIVFNGSPLFTGSADSGPSNIRRWIIKHDWLEAIIALPDQLFYNTGISTYVWILTNRKPSHKVGKVQLIDARTFFKKMKKSLGNKRNEISEEHRDVITQLYRDYTDGEYVKIFDNEDFGYQRITVERPLKLNFAVTDERIAQLREASAFAALAILDRVLHHCTTMNIRGQSYRMKDRKNLHSASI